MVILKFELFAIIIVCAVPLPMLIFLLYAKCKWSEEKKYNTALWILNLFPNKSKRQLTEKLKSIHPGEREEMLLGKYCLNLFLGVYITIMVLGVLIPVYYQQSKGEHILSDGNQIERRGYGEGGRDIRIKASIESDEKEMDISVSELAYTEEELAEKQKQAQIYISEVYLGENASADNVTKPLNLVKRVPDSAISVSWNTDGSGIIGEDGEIINNDLSEPVKVELEAVLKYEKTKKEVVFEVTVLPPERDGRELLWQSLKEKVEEMNDSTRENRFFMLPQEIDGHSVVYGEAENGHAVIVSCLMFLSVIIIPMILKSSVDKQLNKREKEIARDYPDLVDRFMLLISAGLTVQGAWYRISDEYQKKRDMTGKKRYLYEEMLVTRSELENGVSEMKAYEMFGKRMGLLSYLKFSNLLVQNLRKGTADLLDILSYESVNALSERKEQAKALGEEAGTKLLLPMMFNLMVVFGMIIYAAFQSM